MQELMVQSMLNSNYQERPNVSKIKEIFTTISRQPTNFSHSCPVPKILPLFQGRKKLIHNLATLIENDKASNKHVLLYGIPGTGKRSIVSELCHQYSESKIFSGGIYWFRSDSKRILETSYSNLMDERKHLRNKRDGTYIKLISKHFNK